RISSTHQTGTHVDIGVPQSAVTTANGRVVIASAPSPSSHRGGTLYLATYSLGFTDIDPGTSYDGLSWGNLALTNDGLVGFSRTGGATSDALVPDLAQRLPSPTNGGRTYTFQLRPGIRYSDGHMVRASDVRFALERTLRLHGGPSPPASYYANIVGATAC